MIRGTKRPRVKAVEIIESKAQKIDAKFNASIHNRFDIEVVDAKTGEIKQRAQAENVICNQLWTRLLTPSSYFSYIFIGTGSGTPASSDTSLFTHLTYKQAITPSYNYDFEEGWVSLRQQCQLIDSEYVGSILTEVGIGYGTTSSNLCTHAMLKDMNGNTITIEKTGTDIINFYATIFVHWDAGGSDSGAIKITPPKTHTSSGLGLLIPYLLGIGGSLSLLAWDAQGGVYSHINTASTGPTGTYIGNLTTVYSSANKRITLTADRVPVGSGNVTGGIGAICLVSRYMAGGSSYGYSYIIHPSVVLKVGGSWCAGTAIVAEAIGTGNGSSLNFVTAFDRVQPGAKIYIDGVEQTSGVTVATNIPFAYNDMGVYFELLDLSPITATTFPSPIAQTSVANYGGYPPVGATAIYYNPYWAYGIKLGYAYKATVYVSDDLNTWIDITSQMSNISAVYRTYKYWKVVSTGEGSNINTLTSDTITTNSNIHFDNAPASGAVITADYTTKTIAKDANHVFDLTVTIQLGEYTE